MMNEYYCLNGHSFFTPKDSEIVECPEHPWKKTKKINKIKEFNQTVNNFFPKIPELTKNFDQKITYTCKYCKKIFMSHRNLYDHKKKHQKKILYPEFETFAQNVKQLK